MSKINRFDKVLEVSLGVAMAPGFLDVSHNSLERIEGLLDDSEGIADSDAIEIDRQFCRSGFLVLALAQLEDVLKEACESFAPFRPTTLRLRDLSGSSDFKKCQSYIQKVIQLDLPSNDKWSLLATYRDARNTMAHRGRLAFGAGREDQRSRVVNLPGVGVDPSSVLILNRDFARELHRFCKSFLDDLHSAAVYLYDHAKSGE